MTKSDKADVFRKEKQLH